MGFLFIIRKNFLPMLKSKLNFYICLSSQSKCAWKDICGAKPCSLAHSAKQTEKEKSALLKKKACIL
jgi:hypothetical protein